MSSEFGKGALRDTYDIRDYHYNPRATTPFDWDEGYDVEEVIGKKLVTKDQNGSYSCGGQAWAYYGEVLEAIATGNYEPRSARWIYSHTAAPGGGSDGRTNCHFVKTHGFVQESYATSYENGKPPKEPFMLIKPILSKEAIEDKEVSKAFSYLQVKGNIDTLATALRDNNGVIIVVDGEDNGTWRSEYPKPPTNPEWRHWLYVLKAKKINGKKYLGVKNSWGDKTGKNGIQWLGEDYIPYIDHGWTLAWDYEPAKHKLILKQMVKLLTQLVALLKQKNDK